MLSFFNLLLVFFVSVTLVILVTGVIVMGRGGEFDRKWSNRLMTARIVFQALAIVTLLGLVFTYGN